MEDAMALNLMEEKGTPLDQQRFTWRDLVRIPFSKLDDDAFTRVRVILMNGIESDVIRFSHALNRLFTKLNALTIAAGEFQTHDYYMNIGPTFADPVARQVYAEIASIEEQHVIQYESIADPDETWIDYNSHRDYVRQVLSQEVNLRAVDGRFIDVTKEQESQATIAYRKQLNSEGSPTNTVAAGYRWQPGTEVVEIGKEVEPA
jgi:hypothetical protein